MFSKKRGSDPNFNMVCIILNYFIFLENKMDTLSPELHEFIFNFLSLKDQTNLASSSKKIYGFWKHYLRPKIKFRTLKFNFFSDYELEKNFLMKRCKILSLLKAHDITHYSFNYSVEFQGNVFEHQNQYYLTGNYKITGVYGVINQSNSFVTEGCFLNNNLFGLLYFHFKDLITDWEELLYLSFRSDGSISLLILKLSSIKLYEITQKRKKETLFTLGRKEVTLSTILKYYPQISIPTNNIKVNKFINRTLKYLKRRYTYILEGTSFTINEKIEKKWVRKKINTVSVRGKHANHFRYKIKSLSNFPF